MFEKRSKRDHNQGKRNETCEYTERRGTPAANCGNSKNNRESLHGLDERS